MGRQHSAPAGPAGRTVEILRRPAGGCDASGDGHSLIEVLLALAVAAVLAALAYPVYSGQIRQARRAQAESLLFEAQQYLQRYYAAHSGYAGADLAVPGLSRSPKGAAPGSEDYTLSVAVRDDGLGYQLSASLAAGQSDTLCGNLGLSSEGLQTSSTGADRACWR